MIFLLLLVMAGLTYLVSNLTPESLEARRAQQSQEVLSQARDALIGYALQYREQQIKTGTLDAMYGYLPMPDVGTSRFHANQSPACNTEGCAMNFVNGAFPSDTETVIGRLPWHTLGMEPLRDGHGECLWYIVSANHKSLGISTTVRMNWDSLSHLDVVVADGTAALSSALTPAHDRPVAVIFSPGPPLPGQNRAPVGGDDVTRCGGNYDAANYLDPAAAAALGGVTNYFPDPDPLKKNASAPTDPNTPKKLSLQGKVFDSGGNFLPNACQGADCSLVANDLGLSLTSDTLFGAIRKHAYFRTDINSLLDRITDCLRDSGVPGGYGKIGGTDDGSLCYGSQAVPRGYFKHYKEMIFTTGGTMQVNGVSNCAGALLFSNQRGAGQLRVTNADKNNLPGIYDNYLEGINLSSFKTPDTVFSGQEIFERVSINQTAHQDIVRCVPSSPGFGTTKSPGLIAAGLPQLANYSPTTHTLTLGQSVPIAYPPSVANFLYGCAWRPETHAMGGGLRSYFTFRINDDLAPGITMPTLGFTFTLADGDNNGADACGAAGQHLGYSGNNTESPFIVPPKIAFEVDPRREGAVFPSSGTPSSTSHLTNGRSDPPTDAANYRGGHVALVYWGAETPFSAPAISPCVAPAYLSGSVCTLPQEEDDNVHGQAASARTGYPAPPPNPAAPIPRLTVPPDAPAGVYKLDPGTASVPVSTPSNPQFFHVRVELTRAATSYNLPRVRVATTGDIDLAAPGMIDANGIHLFQVDDVYLFHGDRVLVKNQGDPKQNGIYVWQGANQAMKRAGDASSVEALAGLIVEVMQGTIHARQLWRQLTVQPVTCADPDLEPNCTSFYWQPVQVTQYSDLPSASTQPGRVVYVQKGDQANGWFHSDGSSWLRVWAHLSTQEAIDLTSTPATIDSILPAAGSHILVRHQANAAENGVYIWNGVGVAIGSMVAELDSGPELAGALVQVLSGSDAGRAFRQTAMPFAGTVGTSAIRWEAIDPSPRYQLEVWLLRDGTSSQLISAMQDTTRPMNFLTAAMNPPPNFPPHLRDTPVIPYSFRNVRPGFTIGQRTSANDQTVTIGDYFTTWLP